MSAVDDIADGEQIGAAMMVDDALGVAGGARRVVERNGVPFIGRSGALESLVALGDQRLVVEGAKPLVGTVIFGIVVIDDERPGLGELQRRGGRSGEFAVDDQRLGFAVVENEGERGGIETGVESIEDRAAHRHAVMAFQHRRRVGEHGGDRVAALEFSFGERGGELLGSAVEAAVVAPKPAVNDRGPIGKHRRGAFEEAERGQRLKIGGVAVQIVVITRLGHGRPPHGWWAPSLRRHTGPTRGIYRHQWRKAKERKPMKVRTIAAPLPAATNRGRIAGVTAIPALGAMSTQAEYTE